MAVVTLLSARFVGAASGPGLALRVAVGVMAGVTVYVAAARRLGVDEFFALLPLRRRGIRKGKGRPG
jgi:hypothetical protein